MPTPYRNLYRQRLSSTSLWPQDGSYTFHGRSDEVINVGGIRIGTEEIENALLADR